ncbi:MAG: hypothetical protein ACSHX0_12905 [Akkermansiaceae bacterium]
MRKSHTTLGSVLIDSLCAFIPVFFVATFLSFCSSTSLAILGRSLGIPGSQKTNTLESFYSLQPFVFLLAVLVSAIIASSTRLVNHHHSNVAQPPADCENPIKLDQTNGKKDATMKEP